MVGRGGEEGLDLGVGLRAVLVGGRQGRRWMIGSLEDVDGFFLEVGEG